MQKGSNFRNISCNLQDLLGGEMVGKKGEEKPRMTTAYGCCYQELRYEFTMRTDGGRWWIPFQTHNVSGAFGTAGWRYIGMFMFYKLFHMFCLMWTIWWHNVALFPILLRWGNRGSERVNELFKTIETVEGCYSPWLQLSITDFKKEFSRCDSGK